MIFRSVLLSIPYYRKIRGYRPKQYLFESGNTNAKDRGLKFNSLFEQY